MKISVAIVAYNEEANIAECLKSVAWADEIVVLDGKSTDATPAIAKKFRAKIFQMENQGIKEKMMNELWPKCHGEWILNIDADERVTPGLRDEILSIILKKPEFVGYEIPRKNFIFGKWMEHSDWATDFQLRLFQKDKLEVKEKNIHEQLSVDGSVGRLSSPLQHWHYTSISQFVLRHDKYAASEAERIIKGGKQVTWVDAINFPLHEFLSRFFVRGGYKEGLHGLVFCLLLAFYWELVFAKVWEKQGFWEYDSKDFLGEVAKQAKGAAHEWNYWVRQSGGKRKWLKKFFSWR